ncbi:fimbrial protein, partial [Escherichia sp. WS533]|uniref:fimbrial protein n=1 Tax=Escherichia sp. WS533 TaxID=3382001 RepID=UPI00396CEBC2
MKYNNIIFLGLCLGLTTYSALSADSVIKISGRVLDYGCTVSSDSLNFTVDLQKNSARQFPTTGREGANKQVISSQADSLIKISRIWADFFPANTSNQPI